MPKCLLKIWAQLISWRYTSGNKIGDIISPSLYYFMIDWKYYEDITVPPQDSSLGTTGNSGAWLCLKPASWIVWSIHILKRKHVVHNLYFPEDECLFWQKISSRKLVLYNLLQLQPWCIDHVNFIFWILGFKFIYKLTNKKYCNLDQMSK